MLQYHQGHLSQIDDLYNFSLLNATHLNSTAHILDTTSWNAASFVLHIIGIVINIAFAYVVCTDRTSSAGPRLLIGNIAICGLAMTLVLLPAITVEGIIPAKEYVTRCNFTTATFFFLAVYSWADVCLAFNRTIAICFPHHYGRFRRARTTMVIIGSSWLLCLTCTLFVRFQVGIAFEELASGVCTVRVVSAFGMFYGSLCSVLPYMFVGVASLVIFITVHMRTRSAAWSTVEMAQANRLMRRRLVLAKAMVGSLAWSLICTMPTLLILSVFGETAKKNPSMDRWTSISMFLLYAFNPVIYFVASPSYQQMLWQKIICCRGRVQPSLDASVQPHSRGGQVTTVSSGQHA